MRRRRAMLLVAAAVLAGPTVLAFARGGYFEAARDAAIGVAGVLLVVVAACAPRPLPRSAAARTALTGLALLTLWTGVSIAWAPLADPAWASFERDVLYLAALVVAVAALRPRGVARAAEPALAAGALVVLGYGLLGRLLPDVVDIMSSLSAGGRLDQPMTYWNAMGALGAIGVVLCARLAGDATRPVLLRCAAAAGAVPLSTALYLTFSRGALAACAAGIVVLLALAPTFTQLRAVAITIEAGVIGAFGAAVSPSVRTPGGDDAALQGAAVLAWLLAVMVLAAGVQRWACSVERAGSSRLGRLPLPPRHGLVAAALVVAMLVVPVAIATRQDGPSSAGERFGATAGRLTSADSPRYDYWRVALRSFGDDPLWGSGAGGFVVDWLRERPEIRAARDAHSLPVETLAELGLVGGLALALVVGGVVLSARDVQRRDPALAAGLAAGLAAYAFHASIDWDWEMPALTLVAVALAGALLARHDEHSPSSATAASTTSPGSAANRNRVEP
jgi:hypothetical protein